MPKYKKCPRCDINYITEDREYCDICIAEMRGQNLFAEDDEDEVSDELCPRCHVNYLSEGEKLCESCRAEIEKTKGVPEEDWGLAEPEPVEEEEEAPVDENDVIIPDEVSLEGLAEEESWTGDEDEEKTEEGTEEALSEEALEAEDLDEEDEEEEEEEELRDKSEK
jgi:hypothetical protein